MEESSSVLSENEKRELVNKIERKRQELAEKKKLLETLIEPKGGFEIPKKTVTSSQALLNQVTSELEKISLTHAHPAAETTTKGSGQGAPDIDIRTTQIRSSLAFRKVVGSLTPQAATINVNITPFSMERFEKSCQCSEITETDTSIPPIDTKRTDILSPDIKITKVEDKDFIETAALVSAANDSEASAESIKEPFEKVTKKLSEAEKEELLHSFHFESFFSKASRIVEKALDGYERLDVLADYSTLLAAEDRTSDTHPEGLKTLGHFTDERWSSQRPVMGLGAHPKFNELFLACYGEKKNASVSDPDGCTLVWNVSLTQRPEFVFMCQSQVCCAIFDTFHPNCIIGGTFSGSIVLWDTREKTRPVQRTPLSQKGHRNPVYSVNLIGSQHAHNLITADRDGRVCVWSRSMLTQPTENIDIRRGSNKQQILCMSFSKGESNNFMIGSDDGWISQIQLHGSEDHVRCSYSSHMAPITAVNFHPSNLETEDNNSYSDLLLSSSFDWTVKLWSCKSRQTLLQSFEASDEYCLDVQWHPKNPAIFVSCQSDATVQLWDLSKSFEAPSSVKSNEALAFLKLKWINEGSQLIAGNTGGVVSLWGVIPEISQPRSEACERFQAKLENLRATAIGVA